MATALLHCSLPSLRTRRGIVRSPARASPLLSNACCAHSTPQAFFTARSSRTTSQLDVRTHAATQDSGLSAADPSRWITGATPNAPLIRFVALLGALALASQGKVLGATVKSLSFVHLLAWAAWFGTMFYTTFVAGIAMFKQLPRQTFRDVQEVLFPAYFQTSTACIALLCVLAPVVLPVVTGQQWQLLGASMLASLLNLFWLEPETTKVMKTRASLEKMSPSEAALLYTEGKEAKLKALGKSFGAFHGMSSIFNLSALVTGIVYAYTALV